MEKGGRTVARIYLLCLLNSSSPPWPLYSISKASVTSGATRTLDAALKKGSTILNLKCVDAQTGLMGKSLLEFQSTKGDVLPAHKYSSITVAFDDISEEGLNSPLRLEKVANEVTYRRMKDALIQLTK